MPTIYSFVDCRENAILGIGDDCGFDEYDLDETFDDYFEDLDDVPEDVLEEMEKEFALA